MIIHFEDSIEPLNFAKHSVVYPAAYAYLEPFQGNLGTPNLQALVTKTHGTMVPEEQNIVTKVGHFGPWKNVFKVSGDIVLLKKLVIFKRFTFLFVWNPTKMFVSISLNGQKVTFIRLTVFTKLGIYFVEFFLYFR